MSTNTNINNNINTNTNTSTNTNTTTITSTTTNTNTDTETKTNTNTVLSFSFDFKSCTPPKDVLALVGDAYYPLDNRCLSLIAADKSGAPVPSSYGRAIYVKSAVTFSGPVAGQRASFLTTIKFIITRPQGSSKPPGDGLVFFMAPVGYEFPKRTTDGNFGIFDQDSVDKPLPAPPVFAIEFDTYTNSWDPTGEHLGIDVQYRVSNETKPISSPDSFIGEEVTMKICYEGTSGRIFAAATAKGNTSEVRFQYDLSSVLPSQVAVGLAASTGGSCAAFHNVNFWEFTSTTPA